MIRRAFSKFACGVGLLAASSPMSDRARAAPVEESLDDALNSFLRAFDNLDWSTFRGYFSRDATVFHPDSSHMRRVDSLEQFEKAWVEVFNRIRSSSNRTAPPYINLAPKDVRKDLLSNDIALVTFHLVSHTRLGRRSIVWKKGTDGWRIVHLHASSFDLRPE